MSDSWFSPAASRGQFLRSRCRMPVVSASLLVMMLACAASIRAQEIQSPWQDSRLQHRRSLRDAYHPWTPAASRDGWERQSREIRERILISNGLWPMPEFAPLKPAIHGRIDRPGYTVEKVSFESLPGLLVSGNLYRPAGRPNQKLPAVLSPHGHWANGRFYDAGDAAARQQLETGAEKFVSAARFPLQARMAELARQGCIVFHYDMIGYADSRPLDHRQGFSSLEATLWQQNLMGLQTLNSLRALDFICQLPDVDTDRIGVTGASGGGTQTFILCAIDKRPAVAFPAVMVSTAMQGGCVCENAPYLRINVNNVAFAALMAPRPLAMSGADDWTIDIETRGLPELKQVYGLFGRESLVSAKCFPQFPHNYNLVSREMMYDWFRQNLRLDGSQTAGERELEPILPAELSVFDTDHPRPAHLLSATELQDQMRAESQSQFTSRVPRTPGDLQAFREFMAPVVRVLLDAEVPDPGDLRESRSEARTADGITRVSGQIGHRNGDDAIAYEVSIPPEFNGHLVIGVAEGGMQSAWTSTERDLLLSNGFGLAAVDVFLTGESFQGQKIPAVDETFPGYTLGYNRPLISERVRDLTTLIGAASNDKPIRGTHLVGRGSGGIWALLAAAAAGDKISSAVVDLDGKSLVQVDSLQSPDLLPGSARYGGLGGLVSVACPTPLSIYGVGEQSMAEFEPLQRVYALSGGPLRVDSRDLTSQRLLEALNRAAGR